MQRKSGILFLVVLLVTMTFLGCADLKTIDFTGPIPLTPRETTGGVGMVGLGETTVENHWPLNRDLYFRPSGLNDYLSTLIWERAYLSRDAVSFTKETWICETPYSVTTTVNRHGKIYLEVVGRNNDFQILNNLAWNESGDPWWKTFDFQNMDWESGSLSHEAVLKDSFIHPQSGRQFLVRSQYRFEVRCHKAYLENNGLKEIDPAQSALDLKLHIETTAGYFQYLCGEKTFTDQKGRKATITAVLYDRDLDGNFTENDGVDFSISNSFYHRDNIPFGKPVKVDSKSAVSYVLYLNRNNDGSYVLDIKQAS